MKENSKIVVDQFFFKSDTGFNGLSEKVKRAFEEQMTLKHFKKGQNIFTEGNYPSGIFFIKKGKLKKYKMVNNGKEQIIYVCSEGELIGYAALLGEECYPDSAATITDATIGFISKERLLKLLGQHEELSAMLTKSLCHEFGVLINLISTFTHKSVRERLSLALLILNEKFKDASDDSHPSLITLSREELASFVGVAVETLIRFLHDFKAEDLIEISGRSITVKNIPVLLELANISDSF